MNRPRTAAAIRLTSSMSTPLSIPSLSAFVYTKLRAPCFCRRSISSSGRIWVSRVQPDTDTRPPRTSTATSTRWPHVSSAVSRNSASV